MFTKCQPKPFDAKPADLVGRQSGREEHGTGQHEPDERGQAAKEDRASDDSTRRQRRPGNRETKEKKKPEGHI